jgi:hypothetical protein
VTLQPAGGDRPPRWDDGSAEVLAEGGEEGVHETMSKHVRAFAGLLTDRRGEDLEDWMSAVEASDLPALNGFVRGLRKDLPAVTAGLSLPYSNGPTEGANTKVKLLQRQDVRTSRLRPAPAPDPGPANPSPPLLRQSR